MRVLFATIPESTHFLAMAPLAWALRTAGHEVWFASQQSFTGTITSAGLTAVAVGRNIDPRRVEDAEERRALRAGIPSPYHAAVGDPGDASWESLTAGYHEAVHWWHRMDNVHLIADLVDLARYWRPDLVLWEPTSYAAVIAAKSCGAAQARLLYTLDLFGVTRELLLRSRAEPDPADRSDEMTRWLASYGSRYDYEFSEDMVTGQFTIDQLPSSLGLRADLHYVPMRYTPYGGPSVVPSWLSEPIGRPRIALTLGISATERFDGYTVDVRDILAALADLDLEVVATIAEPQRQALGRVPDNARVVPYVPLQALVPTCAAVIHHGGFGTLSTTALAGVPQLVLPFHFDQPAFADRLAQHGAGLSLHSDGATGDLVRERLLKLLGAPSFRDRAIDLRDEMLAQPTPNEVAERLESLVDTYRSRTRSATDATPGR